MDNHRLKTWLQLHLITDASALINLPFVLNSITEEDFLSHDLVQKWTTRISSLMHSKDPGARWAGMSIALRTAILSRDAMNECAHAWITVTLPMLFVGRSRDSGVLHNSYPPRLIEKRNITVHQSLHPFDTICLLDQHWTCRVSASGRSSKHRQVFARFD